MNKYEVITPQGIYHVYADSPYAAKRNVFEMVCGRVPFADMDVRRCA